MEEKRSMNQSQMQHGTVLKTTISHSVCINFINVSVPLLSNNHLNPFMLIASPNWDTYFDGKSWNNSGTNGLYITTVSTYSTFSTSPLTCFVLGVNTWQNRLKNKRNTLLFFMALSFSEDHMRGNRGSRGSSCSSSNKIIGEATSTSCSPNFSITKSSLTDCNISTQKNLANFPASGALPQTPLYTVTAYTFFEKYMLHKVIFWIWLSWLFFSDFCSPNRKIVPASMVKTVWRVQKRWRCKISFLLC